MCWYWFVGALIWFAIQSYVAVEGRVELACCKMPINNYVKTAIVKANVTFQNG